MRVWREGTLRMNKYLQQFRGKCFAVIGIQCAKCGAVEDLEIDHVDWRTKTLEISKSMGSAKWPAVLEELKKCQALCGKCHREKSAAEAIERAAAEVHGTAYRYRQGCRCGECRHAQVAYRRTWKMRTGRAGKIRGEYSKAVCGTSSMYRNGCRCVDCKRAHAEVARLARMGLSLNRQKQPA